MPSKELYPIHHLDDHEFFPGDFVTEAKDGFHPHSYGVVQEVKSTKKFFFDENILMPSRKVIVLYTCNATNID